MTRFVLDPAHGGDVYAGRSSPYGATSAEGVREKDVSLRLARRLAAHLGRDAAITRNRDENVSLARRAAIARRHGADVFLSLHATPSSGRGTRVWVHRDASAESHRLAGSLARALCNRYGGSECVGVSELAVLSPSAHRAETASALIEADVWGHGDSELDAFAQTIADASRSFGGGHGGAGCSCQGYASPHGADELYPVYGRGGSTAGALDTRGSQGGGGSPGPSTRPPATQPAAPTPACPTGSNMVLPLGFNTPARDLTRDQAREILVYLANQNTPGGHPEITFFDGNHSRMPALDASCHVTWPANPSPPSAANNVRLSTTISDVQFVYIDGHGEHPAPALDNVDMRLAVLLWRLATRLRTTWGATKILHLGIGHGNPAHPDDCHNRGRAIDFAGGEGTRSGTHWRFEVQRDWGNAPAVAGNNPRHYRLNPPAGGAPSAFQFFLDVYNFATGQAEDKSTTPGQSTTLGATFLTPTVWQSSPGHGSYIVFPDHPNLPLAASHQNHIHMQVGPTRDPGWP